MFSKAFEIFDDLSSLNCSSNIALALDTRGRTVNEFKSFS